MVRILIVNGHPDGSSSRLCAALAAAYERGALAGGHQSRRVDLAGLAFPLITTQQEFEQGHPPPAIVDLQHAIIWADHLVLIHPLWLGGVPARLKGLLEQTFRYGFALAAPGENGAVGGLLKGRSARIIVTMGMPAAVFRLAFGAFGVRAVERGILFLSGVRPIRRSLIGGVAGMTPERAARLFNQMADLGRKAG